MKKHYFFFEKVNEFRKRIGMFTQYQKYDSICAFIMGADFVCGNNSMNEFRYWFIKKYNISNAVFGWPETIEKKFSQRKEGSLIEKMFEEIDEFYKIIKTDGDKGTSA